MKKSTSKTAILAFMCFATLGQVARAQDPDSSAAAIAAQGVARSEVEITRIATAVANSRQFFHDDYGRIRVEARYDLAQGVLFLDPGIRFGPISGYAEVEELQDEVNLAVRPIAKLLPNYVRIDWLYGGRDLYYWFPEDRRPSDDAAPRQGAVTRFGGSMLVSAGHGYYFHHGYKDWRPQREASNGVLEDQITPVLAEGLGNELMRQGIVVTYSRTADPRDHEPSKQPYLMVAARYQLEELLSFMPSIWHSLPDSTSPIREYLEDIRSRPLYANFLEVDELVHLHTNASENVAARGATVVVHKGRSEDAKFGNMVLCYMKEQVRAIPDYATYPVESSVHEGDKGENRLANMPSIIVEVGFHTNVQDAEALKDVRFRNAAVRGIAKGYRLYKNGQSCEAFTLSAPKESQGSAGEVVRFPLTFSGNPDFPVALSVIEKDCDAWYCHRSSLVFYSKEDYDEYAHGFLCRSGDAFRPESILVAKAHDKNDIESPEIEHSVHCAPGSA
ncbi:N-acetylmuramoyl-L-alanine amidase [Luteibacter sp. 621]|uniref:N-acetylmuramoyl-L-alanine amidase family protein n=1 Tax=Luteibacter sp. 621 TaxID=3373916 RepID=UPI003D259622